MHVVSTCYRVLGVHSLGIQGACVYIAIKIHEPIVPKNALSALWFMYYYINEPVDVSFCWYCA